MDILLETERLILRRLTVADAESVYMIRLEIAKSNDLPTLNDTRNRWLPFILSYYQQGHGFGYWAAIEKMTDDFIGWFYFRSAPNQASDTAIGYFLKKSAWGKGYASEGAAALMLKGFTELRVKRVVATARSDNVASIRVMEKVGLRFEKLFIDDTSGTEVVRYCLLREDFDVSPYSLG